MLLALLRNGFDPVKIIAFIFSMAFVVFCTMPVHEYAHALVATKLGDQTPRLQGRLTLNPIAHISPLGAVMILLVGFGYAKPVSVNARNFKNPKFGMALTALAGPISNLLMALVFSILSVICYHHIDKNTSKGLLMLAVYTFLYFAAYVNIQLAVFNLIPIPPLDGSRLLQVFVPQKYYFKLLQYERYIIIAIFVLLFTGILSTPLSFLTSVIFNLFQKLGELIF
ncbi:MAG: site-2 protease family protein [Clostridiales bacterium]|nr:site-2 protease family protein [Clostridiales bacterium]